MKYLLCILLTLLLSCTSTTRPLSERGLSQSKRVEYIEKNGARYSPKTKQQFIEKRIGPGFDRDLVEIMYGKPNMVVQDSIWYYTDKWGDALIRIEFESSGFVKTAER